MKRLFFVRHGETEMNVSKHWTGHNETPLTDNGRYQAKQAGKELKSRLPKIDLIIASPFSRAYHTAQIIAEEVGYPTDEIKTSKLLAERKYGVLEGTSSANYFDNHTFEDIDKVEGSETVSQLHERALKAYDYIKSYKQDNILVVSHGTFGRALRRVVENLPHSIEYQEQHRKNYRIANAEIVELI